MVFNSTGMETAHVPVLLAESVAALNCRAGGVYVDATVGSGGHAFKILDDFPHIKALIAIDWDAHAIQKARRRLERFSDKLHIIKNNFTALRSILLAERIEKVDGILIDLGVSSLQLEDPARGFSFKLEGPLDMRMDTTLPTTAFDLVNTSTVEELRHMFHTYGEERFASRIARTIIARRTQEPIADTVTLSNMVTASIPPRYRSTTIHPATRTFQALRIAVNGELDNLTRVIGEGIDLLAAGGRICIISFHSLEDRVVKQEFKKRARGYGEETAAPHPHLTHPPTIKIITKKPITPQPDELQHNLRARSAKLRVAEKIEPC